MERLTFLVDALNLPGRFRHSVSVNGIGFKNEPLFADNCLRGKSFGMWLDCVHFLKHDFSDIHGRGAAFRSQQHSGQVKNLRKSCIEIPATTDVTPERTSR